MFLPCSWQCSDKALTKESGKLDFFEEGDSVMADRGFEIEKDLLLTNVHLNIPPFLHGKSQLSGNELIIKEYGSTPYLRIG